MKRITAILAILAALAGCNQGGDKQEITETREIKAPEQPAQQPTGSAQRFGMQGMPPAAAAGPAFAFEKPEAWQEQAPSQFQLAKFTAGPEGQVEVSLSTARGGLVDNANRWRKQIGQPDLTAEEIAALPKAPMLGGEATLFDTTGTYSGMGGAANENYRLAGLILDRGGEGVFVKMVGPADAVGAELDNLKAFAASLKEDPTAGAMAGDPHAGVPGMGAEDPHAGVPGMGAADPHAGIPGMSGAMGGLVGGMGNAADADVEWTVPAGWQPGPDKPMRFVTFSLGENAEVYISKLSGPAGGVLPNVNRWRSQMGVTEPMTEEQLAQLPKVTVMGQECPVVEIPGHFTSATGEEVPDALMIATPCLTPTGLYTVKMTGPAATVSAQKDNFIAFVQSLKAKQP